MLPSAGSPLPRDIVARAAERVKIAAMVFAATWVFVIVMNEGVARLVLPPSLIPQLWGIRQTILTLLGLVASIAMAAVAGRLRDQPDKVINLGLGFEVLNSLVVAFVSEWVPR